MDIPKEYIRKYWFGIEKEEELADVVLLMERDRIEQYKAALDITTNHFNGVFKGITGFLKNRKISVIYSIGPAHIADCVNFLAHSFLISRIFSTGSIGGLNTEMGDIVVANACATQDGYSLAVFPEQMISDVQIGNFVSIESSSSCKVSEDVAAEINRMFDCTIKSGAIFTIPCVSMEDRQTLEVIQGRKFIALDLETGPFLAACEFNKIMGTCIHWVTDLPLTRDFYYPYHGEPGVVRNDKEKKHKQWLNQPKIVLPILLDLL